MRKASKRRNGARIAAAVFAVFLLWLLLATLIPVTHHKEVDPEFKAQIAQQQYYSDTVGTERVRCVDDNTEALIRRLQLIENAQKEICFSTFEMREDNSGTDVMAALLHAADRGVKVRVLVDGISGVMRLSTSSLMKGLAGHENVEVRLYNPPSIKQVADPWTIQMRMHDKYLIIDQQMYLLGGRNTYDYFLGDYGEVKNFDRELLVWQTEQRTGSSMEQLRDYFSQVWQQPCCRVMQGHKGERGEDARHQLEQHYQELKALYPSAFESVDWQSITMETNRITLLSNPIEPENKAPELWYTMVQLMRQEEDVLIQTPYIICSDAMYQDLRDLNNEQERVRIITNSVESGANPWGCAEYLNNKDDILDTGTPVYEFVGGNSIHTKSVVLGNRASLVGSYNMDMRSTYLDTELMLMVDSVQLNEQLRNSVQSDIDKSRIALPDGTVEYGAAYVPMEWPLNRRIGYTIFRALIIPLRNLL